MNVQEGLAGRYMIPKRLPPIVKRWGAGPHPFDVHNPTPTRRFVRYQDVSSPNVQRPELSGPSPSNEMHLLSNGRGHFTLELPTDDHRGAQ